MGFYDAEWHLLARKHPTIAKKLEELRCEAVSYEQYEDERKELQEQIDALKRELQQRKKEA